jgi:transcriptional regulator with XRE-family HTH domain
MTAAFLIRDARRLSAIAQEELARLAGTSQSAVARLESGRTSPTVATLERLVGAAGFDLRLELVPKREPDPIIEAYKRDVDRTLLRENLRRTADERLTSLVALQRFGEDLERAVQASRRSGKRRRER